MPSKLVQWRLVWVVYIGFQYSKLYDLLYIVYSAMCSALPNIGEFASYWAINGVIISDFPSRPLQPLHQGSRAIGLQYAYQGGVSYRFI